jgi:HTH-type transcriptional regulator / antitoxin HigA
MISENNIYSDLAIPPGEYLAEVIEELGMTKDELARRMNRPAPKLSAIFNGTKAITPDTALQLEKVVGVPAHIWTGLESEYRLTLARNQEAREIQQQQNETKLVTKYCYADLANLGFVKKTTRPINKVRELQHFFGVTSLKNIPNLKRHQVAFRTGAGNQSQEATSAWLRIGEFQAQRTEAPPFSQKALKHSIPKIRRMTNLLPGKFINSLKKILLECGIVFVLCPHLPKTYTSGATFWLGQNKAVVMLSNRGRWADMFWFSFFHEIGHLRLHGKQLVFLENDNGSELDKREQEANNFAANVLIPLKEYKEFLFDGLFQVDNITDFAKRIKVHPGIIVGRLQHDGLLKISWLNSIRTRYDWK